MAPFYKSKLAAFMKIKAPGTKIDVPFMKNKAPVIKLMTPYS